MCNAIKCTRETNISKGNVPLQYSPFSAVLTCFPSHRADTPTGSWANQSTALVLIINSCARYEGILQASICSSVFFFSFFINDLSKDIKAKLCLYADDEVILTHTSSIVMEERTLNPKCSAEFKPQGKLQSWKMNLCRSGKNPMWGWLQKTFKWVPNISRFTASGSLFAAWERYKFGLSCIVLPLIKTLSGVIFL